MTTEQKPLVFLTAEEEDALVHKRLTGPDEKPLRRLTKKFHQYTSAVSPSPADAMSAPQISDARDGFLIELSNFQLFLNKSALVCQSEARQVKEYELERNRIAKEHFVLRDEIARLKGTLDDAQTSRRQKIEYDAIAEKINTLPSRDELQRAISELEEEIQTIEQRKDAEYKFMQTRQDQFNKIMTDMNLLRSMGNPDSITIDPATPVAEGADEMDGVETETERRPGDYEDEETQLTRDEGLSDQEGSRSSKLNPRSSSFRSRASDLLTSRHAHLREGTTPTSSAPGSPLSVPLPLREEGEEDDIEMEMGEVAETVEDIAAREREREERDREERDKELAERGKRKSTKPKEELEEGEASDASSELSEPPDE